MLEFLTCREPYTGMTLEEIVQSLSHDVFSPPIPPDSDLSFVDLMWLLGIPSLVNKLGHVPVLRTRTAIGNLSAEVSSTPK